MRALKAVIVGFVIAFALTPVAAGAGGDEGILDAHKKGDFATGVWPLLFLAGAC